MTEVRTIGEVPWFRDSMLTRLDDFAQLYARRPITNNAGGMASPHMFLAWFVLQTLAPKAIIESGVFFGQGTWLFENACPNAD